MQINQLSTWIKNNVKPNTPGLIYFPNLNAHCLFLAHLWKQLNFPLYCFSHQILKYNSNLSSSLEIKKISIPDISSYLPNLTEPNLPILQLFLRQFALEKKAMWLSPSDFPDYHILRNSLVDYCYYDLFPLAGLLTEEVMQLCKELTGEEFPPILPLTLEELWAARLHRQQKLLSGTSDPAKSPDFWKYTSSQQKTISAMFQRKQLTNPWLSNKLVFQYE